MNSLKKILPILFCLTLQSNVNAQILKKLKNKIDNSIDRTIDKKLDKTVGAENPNSTTVDYCEDPDVLKNYKLIYKGSDATKIFYDESSISTASNGDTYKIIFKEGSEKNSIYTVIENGKTIYTGNKLTNELAKKPSWALDNRDRMKKYLVVDSTKMSYGGSQAMNGKFADEIDKDNLKTGAELSKQTAEYQAMSAEEKAEYDEFVKTEMPKAADMYNNSGLVGTSYSFKGSEPMTVYLPNSSLVVNGKNYLSKNDVLIDYFVSEDEKNIFIYGNDANGKQFFQANDKRTYIETSQGDYSMSSQLLISNDGKNAAVINILSIPQSNVENVYVNYALTNATITNSDGTKKNIKVNLENYRLTNEGKVLSANKKTGEVFIDGKSVGKFNNNHDNGLDINTLLIGGSTSEKIVKYNPNGGIDFLDGKTKNLGAIFPVVKNIGGKSILYWFMTCNNTVYLANSEL